MNTLLAHDWTCPECFEINKETWIPLELDRLHEVVCGNCKAEFVIKPISRVSHELYQIKAVGHE